MKHVIRGGVISCFDRPLELRHARFEITVGHEQSLATARSSRSRTPRAAHRVQAQPRAAEWRRGHFDATVNSRAARVHDDSGEPNLCAPAQRGRDLGDLVDVTDEVAQVVVSGVYVHLDPVGDTG